jgi:hypothetical protein
MHALQGPQDATDTTLLLWVTSHAGRPARPDYSRLLLPSKATIALKH